MSKQAINNMAVFTGVRTAALSRFIRKYNLDVEKLSQAVMKYKNIRKDLSAAVSGYDDNELAQEIKAKYSLDESRRANDFFASTHGKAIYFLLKRNGKVFNRDLVKTYLDKLKTNDLKWARMMDFIASDLGLNHHAVYNTFGEQEVAMLDAIEVLFNQYQESDDKLVISKQTIDEMVEKAVTQDTEDNKHRPTKKMIINVVQFEALLNHILNPINKSITINEGVLKDTYTFEVYSARLNKFLNFIEELPSISKKEIKKDGHYVHLTLFNSGSFQEWKPVVEFYKEQIKI